MDRDASRILVIKLGALGDFIQALGPMSAIRAHHGDARITLLTTAPFKSLALASGYIDDLLIDTRPRWHDFAGWLDLRRRLNEKKFFRVYDLQNNDRTEFYLKLFSRKPEWVGAAQGASHRNSSKMRTAGTSFDGHVETLSLAGVKSTVPDTLEWMKGRIDFEGLCPPYVLIVPGSAANRPEKRWPAAHYAAFCKNLFSHGYQPVLIGGDAEASILSDIKSAVPQSLNLMGQTSLFDLAALARQAAGALGNDTGPMHLIAPTGCPSIVLFSKNSNPARHAPMGARVITLQKDRLEDLATEDVWKQFKVQQSPMS
jgi:ADP-heptose:LPS heptosyltransferase